MVDVFWPDHRFALELDSRAHHADDRAFESDRSVTSAWSSSGWLYGA